MVLVIRDAILARGDVAVIHGLAGAKTLEEANAVLEKFMAWFNAHCTHDAASLKAWVKCPWGSRADQASGIPCNAMGIAAVVATPLGAEPLNEVEGDDGSAMMVPFPRESTRYVEPTRASRIWGRSLPQCCHQAANLFFCHR